MNEQITAHDVFRAFAGLPRFSAGTAHLLTRKEIIEAVAKNRGIRISRALIRRIDHLLSHLEKNHVDVVYGFGPWEYPIVDDPYYRRYHLKH